MTWTAKNSEGRPSPVGIAIDVVLLTVRDGTLSIVLLDGDPPVLPGGFVEPAETAEKAVRRHLGAKAGIRAPKRIEQLQTFTEPARDPRGWIPTIAYLALVPSTVEVKAEGAGWRGIADGVPRLAYDHTSIAELAMERIKGKLWWSNVAVGILAGAFTLTEARTVYEAIAGVTYDPSTFARDLNKTGLIVATGGHVLTARGRPAALYRFRSQDPEWGHGRRKRVHG